MDTFVDAAIDNFYQNEDTLDGKTNTHSMAAIAAVLYQRWGTLNDDESIPRTGEKALEVTECTEEPLHRHAKPQQMPEPLPVPAASLFEVDKVVLAKGRDKDLVWELARFASKCNTHHPCMKCRDGAMTSDKTVPVTTIRYLHTCTTYRPLHHIYDLVEVGGCSREAGASYLGMVTSCSF